MAHDFDHVPDRRVPGALNKWTYYPKDILPLWVADMDFRTPAPILDALHRLVDHGVLGYELPSDALRGTVAARMERLYGWKVQPEWVVPVTGIVSGFNVAARALSSPRRGYLIQTPVYNEFLELKKGLGIPELDSPLVKSVEGHLLCYEIDWEDFQKQAREAGMFLLCSPHNPLGHIFSRNDLTRMAEICIRNDVVIVSDEIHSELLLDGEGFIPIATLSTEVEQQTITLISASKTFNVPGLFCGFAIIPNTDLRERYVKVVEALRLHVSSAGLQAARAAYSGRCDQWLRDLRGYLKGNRDFLEDYVVRHFPGVRITRPSATYLAWLDFTEWNLSPSPFEFFMQQAKVALSDGSMYGEGGRGHVRLNFGTSRRILTRGLNRMRRALDAA